jgi:hypothetical protein
MDQSRIDELKLRMDQAHREYVKANRWFWVWVAGLAYACFCEWDPSRYAGQHDPRDLILLTEPGISLLGGLSILGVPIMYFIRRSATRELGTASAAWANAYTQKDKSR